MAQTAATIRVSRLEAPDRARAHELLAALAAAVGDMPAQLRWLAQVRSDQVDETGREAVDARIDALLSSMDDATLASAAEQLGKRQPAFRVRLAQAERAFAAGDTATAADALTAARQLPLSEPDVARLAALETRLAEAPTSGLLGLRPSAAPFGALPAGTGVEGTLGVVLPLSGPYAPFGEEVLEGVLLASGLFDAERAAIGASKLRIEVRDSNTGVEGAVRDLAARDDVVAILGPLLADASEAAAVVAEEEEIPLLSFTRREEVAEGRPHVVRVGETPRVEAELLAEYATNQLGLTRFAILYPDDGYGRALRATFWDAVEAARRGGRGRRRATSPGATDFAGPIEQTGRPTSCVSARARRRRSGSARRMLAPRASRIPAEEGRRVLREEARAN